MHLKQKVRIPLLRLTVIQTMVKKLVNRAFIKKLVYAGLSGVRLPKIITEQRNITAT